MLDILPQPYGVAYPGMSSSLRGGLSLFAVMGYTSGMDISIQDDIKQLRRGLTKVQQKQLPFATAQAITDTAFSARKALQVQVNRYIDRPTPFTQRGFLVRRAKKTDLEGAVFIRPEVDKYLRWQIEGGVQTRPITKAKHLLVPVTAKLNQYGNIKGRRSGVIKKKKRQFIGTIHGVEGVWERINRGRNVKLVVAFAPKVRYQKRFPFYKIAGGVVRNTFRKHMERRLARALATARQ